MTENLLKEIEEGRVEMETNKATLERFKNKFAEDLIKNGLDMSPEKRDGKLKKFFRRLLNTLK